MRSILRNKKADDGGGGMIGLIVTIALILIAAILIIAFFARGTGSFGDWLKNLIGGGSNVDSVINGCRSASTVESSKQAYCGQARDLKFDDKTVYKGVTCFSLEKMNKFVKAQKEPINNVDCSGYTYARCNNSAELKGQWKAKCEDATETDVTSSVKDESDKPEDYNLWKSNTKCCAVTKKCSGTSTLPCTSIVATKGDDCTNVGCTYASGATTCSGDKITCSVIASTICANYAGCSLS